MIDQEQEMWASVSDYTRQSVIEVFKVHNTRSLKYAINNFLNKRRQLQIIPHAFSKGVNESTRVVNNGLGSISLC